MDVRSRRCRRCRTPRAPGAPVRRPQPHGLTVTRGRVREVADAEARRWGIEVDKAFVVTTMDDSPLLDKEFRDKPGPRRKADADPALAPRLFGFRVTYWRNGVDKYPPFGDIAVSRTGEVLAVRRQARAEEPGASPKAEDLRPAADAFVASRSFAGAPNPVFEDARPNVQRNRTDHTFRYKVASAVPTGDVVCYLYVNFIGRQARPATQLIEEYRDGRRFAYDTGLGATFLQVRRDLHAPLRPPRDLPEEVPRGRGRASGRAPSSSPCRARPVRHGDRPHRAVVRQRDGPRRHGRRARRRSRSPASSSSSTTSRSRVLVFLAWSVGESFARERWGERLASFDAILRRDPVNATVGGSLLSGLLASPAVAAAALLVPALPLSRAPSGRGSASGQSEALNAVAGPFVVVLSATLDALLFSCVGLLFLLAFFHRKRLLPLGVLLTAGFGVLMGIVPPPVGPFERGAHRRLRRDRGRPPRLRGVRPPRVRDGRVRRRADRLPAPPRRRRVRRRAARARSSRSRSRSRASRSSRRRVSRRGARVAYSLRGPRAAREAHRRARAHQGRDRRREPDPGRAPAVQRTRSSEPRPSPRITAPRRRSAATTSTSCRCPAAGSGSRSATSPATASRAAS